MRKIVIVIVLAFLFSEISAQSKKTKSIFGFEFGFPVMKFNPSEKSGNPLIQGPDPVQGGLGFNGGVFAEFINARKNSSGKYGPGGGLKIRFLYNYFEMGNNQILKDELYKIGYMSGSLVYKICLGSQEVTVPASRDNDEVEFRQRDSRTWDVYYKEGKYNPSYQTVRSFFLYFGPQYSSLNSMIYETDNASYESSYNSKKGNINNSDLAVVAGLEIWLGKIYIDLGYQRSVQSIYNGTDVFISGFIGKFGIGF